MKTSTTTTTDAATDRGARPRLRGWMWFVLLWAGGVAGAVTLGYAFKVFMNLTLLAAK